MIELATGEGQLMEAKELARQVLALKPVRRALHMLNSSPKLSDERRLRLYHRITKKIPPTPDTVFRHQVEGGAQIALHLDGTIRRLYWTGAYETDALPLFTRYAAHSDVILDVGAAEGVYTLFAAAANPDAVVVAFEPGSRQLLRLHANLAENTALLGSRVTVVTEALSDHDGVEDFHELPGGTSSLNPDFRTDTEVHRVEVVRGDELVPTVLGDRPIDLIKVDTESTEPAVLRGLEATISRDRPVIFCEVLAGRVEQELQELVDRWGYRVWWLGPDGPEAANQIVGDPSSQFVNWLFLPDGTHPSP